MNLSGSIVMISVFLIDDQAPMRALLSLRLSLEEDLVVVGDSGTGAAAFARIQADAPHIVILDVMTPVPDIASASSLLSTLTCEAPVIVLSLYDDPVTREILLQAGAAAVVSKHDADDVLMATIRAVVTALPTSSS